MTYLQWSITESTGQFGSNNTIENSATGGSSPRLRHTYPGSGYTGSETIARACAMPSPCSIYTIDYWTNMGGWSGGVENNGAQGAGIMTLAFGGSSVGATPVLGIKQKWAGSNGTNNSAEFYPVFASGVGAVLTTQNYACGTEKKLRFQFYRSGTSTIVAMFDMTSGSAVFVAAATYANELAAKTGDYATIKFEPNANVGYGHIDEINFYGD